jgi:shikimate dehydrogenase
VTISARTEVLAIFGDPVAQSLSPAMHNAWFADHGIDAVYVAVPVPGEAAAFFRGLRSASLRGANITVPHKEAAAALADRAESRVANVWRWERDGSVSAFNTDGKGFIASLDEATPGWGARSILIVGAGGGAAGIAQALAAHDPTTQIVIANRTLRRAENLASLLPKARAAAWDNLAEEFAQADLIVQTTTLGMSGQSDCEWPVARCKTGAVVADIVYKPLETRLLRDARARGLVAVDGLGMLIHQGALAFELWFGIKPDTKAARRRLMEALSENQAGEGA